MTYNIGFIGAGKMVDHIVTGLIKQPEMKNRIVVVGRSAEKLESFNLNKDVEVSTDLESLRECTLIVNGVSAGATVAVFERMTEVLSQHNGVYMSIAGGVTIDDLQSVLPKKKIVRSMPNIAVSAGEGIMMMAGNENIENRDKESINELLGKISIVEWVDESLMRFVPSLTGSSPAYAFIMIEAMADKAVSVGFAREQAYRLAAQALIGSGKLLLETEVHPAALKDQITTSGGSTIQGVMTLEEKGFRKSIMKAMEAVNKANKK